MLSEGGQVTWNHQQLDASLSSRKPFISHPAVRVLLITNRETLCMVWCAERLPIHLSIYLHKSDHFEMCFDKTSLPSTKARHSIHQWGLREESVHAIVHHSYRKLSPYSRMLSLFSLSKWAHRALVFQLFVLFSGIDVWITRPSAYIAMHFLLVMRTRTSIGKHIDANENVLGFVLFVT